MPIPWPLERPIGEERLLLEAAELIYDNDNKPDHRIRRRGDVLFRVGLWQADRVVYEPDNGGGASLPRAMPASSRLMALSQTAVRFDLTDDFASGFVDGLRVEQELTGWRAPWHGPLHLPRAPSASKASRRFFERGTYTACDTCEKNPSHPPFWQVRAARGDS